MASLAAHTEPPPVTAVSSRLPIVSHAIRVVPPLAGLVLLVAAIAKVVAASPPLWLRDLTGYATLAWALAVAVEAAIGALLLAGVAPRVTYRAAAALFTLFAGIAAALFVAGVRSCGCFGAMTVGPLAMMAVDAAFAAYFWFARPRVARPISTLSWSVGVGAAFLAGGVVLFRAPSSPVAVPATAGPTGLAVENATIDLGRINEVDARRIVRIFGVVNVTDRPIQIDRLDASCTCTSTTPSKRRLGPGERAEIEVEVDWAGRRGPQRADVGLTVLDSSAVQWLTVQATVDAGLAVTPSQVNLGPLSPGQIVRQPITLVRTSESREAEVPVALKEIVTSTPALRVLPSPGIRDGASTQGGEAYIVEIDTSALPIGTGGDVEARIRFVPAATDVLPAEVRFTYQAVACVEPLTKSLRFRDTGVETRTAQFRVYCEGVASRTTFDVASEREGQAVVAVRHASQDGRTVVEVDVRSDGQQGTSQTPGAASRLRCWVDGREVSSVALVRF